MVQNEQITIDDVRQKLSVLKNMYLRLKSENEELIKGKEHLQKEIEEQQNKIGALEQKERELRMAQAFLSPADGDDVREARKNVDKIIREIESCIVLLNK